MIRNSAREQLFLAGLSTRSLGRRIHWFDSVSSTQDVLTSLAQDHAEEGWVIAADEQTAGRGRKGAPWHSPQGSGLWFSLLLRPDRPIARTPQLTLTMARALRECLEFDFCLPSTLKEPNDVLISGRKVAGILGESSCLAGSDRLEHLVMGLGVNLSTSFPDELKDIATTLGDHMPTPPRAEDLLARILERFEIFYLAD